MCEAFLTKILIFNFKCFKSQKEKKKKKEKRRKYIYASPSIYSRPKKKTTHVWLFRSRHLGENQRD